RIKRLFTNSHIKTRYLSLSQSIDAAGTQCPPDESSLQLREKHLTHALEAGELAIQSALADASLSARDIDYIAVVTSTGFLCPGLSAHLIKRLGMRVDIGRIDIIGMGCNAGLNGMQSVVNYCKVNPGKKGLLLCVEICSAAYVFDETMRTSVVNSLFGDGAAAAIFCSRSAYTSDRGPAILEFESHIVPDAIDAMRFDFDGSKHSFYLDADIPYVIGTHFETPVRALLKRFNLGTRDISHWIIHSGGRKVIDSIKYNIGLSGHDVRHTESVLQDFGNLSSGSFLFSHRRLLDEQSARQDEYVLMATMGPGATIECCLGRF
ncbi:type III polyketide synthase, partial [Stenotrophomonas maltophilia]